MGRVIGTGGETGRTAARGTSGDAERDTAADCDATESAGDKGRCGCCCCCSLAGAAGDADAATGAAAC